MVDSPLQPAKSTEPPSSDLFVRVAFAQNGGSFSDRLGLGATTPSGQDSRPLQMGPTQRGIDTPNRPIDTPPNIQEGMLSLHYGDANLDQQLASAQGYQMIKIDTPQGMQVRNWMDQNGYFFWFQNADGTSADGKRHYYPQFAKQMCINGLVYDLDAQRLKVNEDYMSQAAAAAGGGNIQSWDRATNPVSYYAALSKLSPQALSVEENNLVDSIRHSANPYYKIYLSDVYTAEAMQPIVQQVLRSGTASLNNPQTLVKLDQAIEVLKDAESTSTGGLAPLNKFPPQNIFTPMDPYRVYTDRNQFYYGFWAGGLDQARHRHAALTTLRNMIAMGALPHIELPPALPPKQ